MNETGSQSTREVLAGFGEKLLGRRRMWRLGRLLYTHARNDVPNFFIGSNGEAQMQQWLLDAYAGEQPLTVLDVGANVGQWCTSLLDAAQARGAATLQVHSFEPMPATHARLRAAVQAHPAGSRVRLVQAALSDAPGKAQMHEFEEGGVTNSLHADPFMRGKPVNVQLDTVDGYCAREGIRTVHMLKVDAEGHDLAVVRGAIGMLREGRVKVAQVEYNVRWVYSRTYLKDAFDLIEGLPYRLGKLTSGGVEFYDAWHPELERFFEANYVIVHRDLAGRIPSHDVTFDQYNTGA